jgi:hypothetical protein
VAAEVGSHARLQSRRPLSRGWGQRGVRA